VDQKKDGELVKVKADEQDNIDKVDRETYRKIFQSMGGFLPCAIIMIMIFCKSNLELSTLDFWNRFAQNDPEVQ
jgi:hypothetical protein